MKFSRRSTEGTNFETERDRSLPLVFSRSMKTGIMDEGMRHQIHVWGSLKLLLRAELKS